MKKIELINKSYVGIVEHISSDSKLEDLEQYIKSNKPMFDKFKGVIVASNYAYDVHIERTHKLWREYFPNANFVDLDANRGHTFGTLDLDGAIFDFCKANDIDWLCKLNDDMLLLAECGWEDGDVPDDADFCYYNGIGFGGMPKYDFDIDRIVKEDFYPQTTAYFINTTKLPELHSKDEVNEVYDYVQSLENYNGKVWEHKEGFTCEDLLKRSVLENELVLHHLTKPDTYIRLLEFVKANNIHDCSHKQLIIDGVLHYQHVGQQCIQI